MIVGIVEIAPETTPTTSSATFDDVSPSRRTRPISSAGCCWPSGRARPAYRPPIRTLACGVSVSHETSCVRTAGSPSAARSGQRCAEQLAIRRGRRARGCGRGSEDESGRGAPCHHHAGRAVERARHAHPLGRLQHRRGRPILGINPSTGRTSYGRARRLENQLEAPPPAPSRARIPQPELINRAG